MAIHENRFLGYFSPREVEALFRALETFRENLPTHQREALLQAAGMADFQ